MQPCTRGPLFGVHSGQWLHMQSAAVSFKWPMSHRYPAMSRFVFLSVSNLVRRWCVTAVTRSRRARHCPGIHSALLTRLPDSAFVPPHFTFGKAIGNEIPLVGRFSRGKTPAGGNDVIFTFHLFACETVRLMSIKALRPQTWLFSRQWTFPCFRDWQTFTHEIKRCHRWMTYSFPSKISDLWSSAVLLQERLLFIISTLIASPLSAAAENNPSFRAPFNVLLC